METLRLPEKVAERVVTVDDGVVTLSGLTSRIPGVVAVMDQLTFALDDVPCPPVKA
jgi:hypothetical protein